jgi:regulator of replication initiation timing
MPTLSQDVLEEIEHEIMDLVEENKILRAERDALLAEIQRIKAAHPDLL